MAGNVWEWNLDWYDSAFYGKAAATLKAAVNSTSASYRVGRSSSFVSGAAYMRAGFRNGDDPSDAGSGIGVRCVRSAP